MDYEFLLWIMYFCYGLCILAQSEVLVALTMDLFPSNIQLFTLLEKC